MSEELDVGGMIAEFKLGKEAESFYGSDIGKYVLGRIEEEIRDASYSLSRVSPWRKRRIQELQNRIQRAETFKAWLADLIIAGRQALSQLQIEE